MDINTWTKSLIKEFLIERSGDLPVDWMSNIMYWCDFTKEFKAFTLHIDYCNWYWISQLELLLDEQVPLLEETWIPTGKKTRFDFQTICKKNKIAVMLIPYT